MIENQLMKGKVGTKAGVSTQDRSSTVAKLVGGKAGGKSPVAIGNGTDVSKVDEAVQAAAEYLQKFRF